MALCFVFFLFEADFAAGFPKNHTMFRSAQSSSSLLYWLLAPESLLRTLNPFFLHAVTFKCVTCLGTKVQMCGRAKVCDMESFLAALGKSVYCVLFVVGCPLTCDLLYFISAPFTTPFTVRSIVPLLLMFGSGFLLFIKSIHRLTGRAECVPLVSVCVVQSFSFLF